MAQAGKEIKRGLRYGRKGGAGKKIIFLMKITKK